ncbi:MAG TPA: type II CAAX endopeptidase family protein [Terriglobales bacterium]|nr:type II CAAX endopeptidase family protein [Terriglobales bacterium]
MSGTMMDNKPLSPSSAEPEPPVAADDAKPPAPASSPSFLMPRGGGRESVLRDVFLGPKGIYPGTRWLIYLAMAFVIFQVEGWLAVSLRSHLSDLWWRMMIEAGMMLAAILPGFVMARIEDRPFGDFGLPARRVFGRNFWVGTLWGIGSLSVLMLALRVAGAFEFGSLALHGMRIWKFAAYYAVLFLVTGFFEDFLMRGYSQWVLSQGMNFWPAAALLSVAFGYIHGGNPGESETGLVATGLIGFFLCLTLRRTGDLWWAVGFHMAWDWGESYLYSVPDSGTILPGHLLNSSLHGPDWLAGGSVGPEGSYLVFAVIGALWVLFDRAYPEVKYGANRGTGTLSSS